MKRVGWLALLLVAVTLFAVVWVLRDVFAPLPPDPAPMAQAPPPEPAAPVAETALPAAPPAPKPVVIKAVARSGVKLRIVRPVPLRRPDAPYGPAYRALLPAAEGGDAAAQYRLGLLLYECRDATADAGELDRQVEKVHQTRRRGGWDVADPAAEAKLMRQEFADCDGVPAAARDTYRDWLRKSADQGLLQAQLDVMYHLPQREYCQYLYQCTPEQRRAQQALQEESLRYVSAARDAGSAAALWTLGTWNQSDEVMPVNEVEAYANYDALDQIQAAAGVERRLTPMLKSLRAKLRPVDLDQAEARARELLSNPRCCVITP